MATTRTCTRCGKPVQSPRRDFCSDACFADARRARDAVAHANFRARQKDERLILERAARSVSAPASGPTLTAIEEALKHVGTACGLMDEMVFTGVNDLIYGNPDDDAKDELLASVRKLSDQITDAYARLSDAYEEVTGTIP